MRTDTPWIMAVRAKGLYSYGLYSYGLYSYGLYSYGLYSYGLYSYGLYSYGLYSYGRKYTEATPWHVYTHVYTHVFTHVYTHACPADEVCGAGWCRSCYYFWRLSGHADGERRGLDRIGG